MPNKFGTLESLDVAIQGFVLQGLEARAMQPTGPKVLNIELAFSQYLNQHGVDELTATDIAAEQKDLIRRKIREQVNRWNGQGVHTPVCFSVESEEILITWHHENFTELTGFEPLNAAYVEIYNWLGSQTGRDFLFPCVCFLKASGCDRIYVTDGARDEGIDCIGIIGSGCLRSTMLLVQARSKNELITRDPLLQEYAKYAALPRTVKYLQYLNALGFAGLQDGAGFLYAVLTNSDFKYAAQQNAARLGVLLRSRRQIANALSQSFSLSKLMELRARTQVPASGDLSSNLASWFVEP